jgi:hypothetical protein
MQRIITRFYVVFHLGIHPVRVKINALDLIHRHTGSASSEARKQSDNNKQFFFIPILKQVVRNALAGIDTRRAWEAAAFAD